MSSVWSAVGPSASREGLRLGMARGRTSVGEIPRPEEDAGREEDEVAFSGKGRRGGRAKDSDRWKKDLRLLVSKLDSYSRDNKQYSRNH